jgi:hypothetical protein
MKWKITDHRTRLKLISAIILLVGLSSAFLIYRSVENVPSSILGYEQGDGVVYPVRPDDSKKYLRDLELYGGKTNVLLDQFRRWLVGLWHRKSLAFTVAGITIFIALGVFYAANHLLSSSESDLDSKNDRAKIGKK